MAVSNVLDATHALPASFSSFEIVCDIAFVIAYSD